MTFLLLYEDCSELTFLQFLGSFLIILLFPISLLKDGVGFGTTANLSKWHRNLLPRMEPAGPMSGLLWWTCVLGLPRTSSASIEGTPCRDGDSFCWLCPEALFPFAGKSLLGLAQPAWVEMLLVNTQTQGHLLCTSKVHQQL